MATSRRTRILHCSFLHLPTTLLYILGATGRMKVAQPKQMADPPKIFLTFQFCIYRFPIAQLAQLTERTLGYEPICQMQKLC